MTSFNKYICVIEHCFMPIFETTFAFVRHMLRILHANTLMCEVACSRSVTSLSLHSFVISCIIVTNCGRFHLGWWIYYVIRPYNGTHREIILLHIHVHEPIKFHDPIITFKMFIFVIIIRFHIIWNMLCIRKHVTQPSTMWSISCSTVMNDIFLRNVCACENDHNLVCTHVPSQCPFTCATKYLSEWEFHHANNIGKTLALYAPSSITFKGWLVHMGEWNKGFLFQIHVIMASITLFFLWNPF